VSLCAPVDTADDPRRGIPGPARPRASIVTVTITAAGASRARVPSVPDPAERTRLAAQVGGLLRRERIGRGWSQRRLEAAAGLSRGYVSDLESGAERLSTTTTRRLAEALRPDGPPVDVAVLDLELQRAAGPSLRRWNRRRLYSARRQRVYDEAARRLDEQTGPDPVVQVAMARLAAALTPRWEPPC
jgi:transcriptional regulator with XRE-family HTH domain